MRLTIAAVVVAFASCKTATTAQKNSAVTAHTIVYKTKADYGKLVPVLLSDDKSKIVSYPDPADLKDASGEYTYPVQLKKGYLLDKRGIGENTAFLKLSYQEYASQPVMRLAEMEKMIFDKDPFTEIYDCANSTNASTLNSMIEKGEIQIRCKKIK